MVNRREVNLMGSELITPFMVMNETNEEMDVYQHMKPKVVKQTDRK